MLHHVHQMGNGHGHQNARKFGLPRSATDAEHVTVARTTDPASGIPAAAAGGREHAVAVVVAIAHVHATPAGEAYRKLGKTDWPLGDDVIESAGCKKPLLKFRFTYASLIIMMRTRKSDNQTDREQGRVTYITDQAS